MNNAIGAAEHLEEFRIIEIRRPQYPLVLKWIDREFHVIYINLDAAEDANIICLLEDDTDEENEPLDEENEPWLEG